MLAMKPLRKDINLPRLQRVLLSYEAGWRVEEIAAKERCSTVRVYQMLKRARILREVGRF